MREDKKSMSVNDRRESSLLQGYGSPFKNPKNKKFIVSIYDCFSSNAGDLNSSPINYFGFGGNDSIIEKVSSRTMRERERWHYYNTNNSHFIFGGGGLITGKVKKMFRLISYQKRDDSKLIAWGIGYNETGVTTQIDYTKVKNCFSGFDLCGIRDYGHDISPAYRYVPCSSCMNSIFDTVKESPRHDVVVYQHYGFPIPGSEKYPTMDNSVVDLKKIISFLSSGKTVVTSAYHGAYWAMLLNRNVIVIPSASRFYGFKYPPIIATNETWETKIKEASPYRYDNYLNECREINISFYESVKKVLSIK